MYGYNKTYIQSLTAANIAAPMKLLTKSALYSLMTGIEFSGDGTVTRATGYIGHYLSNNENPEAADEWELKLLDNFNEYYDKHGDDVTMAYMTKRSVDDVIMQALMGDVYLYIVGIVLMFIYLGISLGDWDRLTSRPLLAVGGVLCVLIGVAAGFGFSSMIGIPTFGMYCDIAC